MAPAQAPRTLTPPQAGTHARDCYQLISTCSSGGRPLLTPRRRRSSVERRRRRRRVISV